MSSAAARGSQFECSEMLMWPAPILISLTAINSTSARRTQLARQFLREAGLLRPLLRALNVAEAGLTMTLTDLQHGLNLDLVLPKN
jgi:hypothetical protein